MKPIIEEKFADNGEHSHWSVIDSETGNVIIEDILGQDEDDLEYKGTMKAKPLEQLDPSGRTSFEIENIDYGVLVSSLDNFENQINATGDDVWNRSVFTKQFMLDCVKRLKKAFKHDGRK